MSSCIFQMRHIETTWWFCARPEMSSHSMDSLLIWMNGHMVISIFRTPLVTSQAVCLEMSSIPCYFKYHNDEILMGKLWRELHPSFKELHFYTEIPRMDKMSGPLQIALGEGSRDVHYWSMLVVRMLTMNFNMLLTSNRNLVRVSMKFTHSPIQLQLTLFTVKQRKFCTQNSSQSV